MLSQLIFAAVCVSALRAFADNLTEQASIIDGDTLEIHGTRIRFWGIDAPESFQLCRNDESLQYRCGANPTAGANSGLCFGVQFWTPIDSLEPERAFSIGEGFRTLETIARPPLFQGGAFDHSANRP